MLAYPMRFLACFLTLALGGCLNSITMANDVIYDVKSFNHDKIWLKSKVDVHNELFELINLHSAAKQLSRKNKSLKSIQIIILFITIYVRIINGFSKLYATTITVLFAGSCITICSAMLMVKVEVVEYISLLSLIMVNMKNPS